jgi:hypothetical protein
MPHPIKKLLLLPGFAVFALACDNAAPPKEGLAKSPAGTGPTIVFNLNERPLPEIPFPNDLATRPDPTSPTGKRINASLVAPTVFEEELRRELNKLDGFGTFSAMTVRFDALLDLSDIKNRHHQDPMDFSDDAIYVVNLNPNSQHFGEPVPLDMGQGNFPLLVEAPEVYFPNDYRADLDNVLFDTTNEDTNSNGVLDAGEDTDFDGVLDLPNTITPNGDPRDDLAAFYERETNTLIIRPLVPLEEESTYAVILTKRLVGVDGAPIQSPFDFINHTEQTAELQPLVDANILTNLGLNFSPSDGGDVAFAWTFTTQSITRDLVTIHDGLYGQGPLARLNEEFPTNDLVLDTLIDQAQPGNPNIKIIKTDTLLSLAGDLGAALGVPAEALGPLIESLQFVDYIAIGSFTGASFLADQTDPEGPVGFLDENGDPRDITGDEISRYSFDSELSRGKGRIGKDRITFAIAIPKKTPGHENQPFPVTYYMHGYTSNRTQFLGFAGHFARHGLATVALEAVGHGLAPDLVTDAAGLDLLTSKGVGSTWKALTNGRDKDLNGDGLGDSGADFFTGYAFHTRDNIRQTAADYIQMTRILRSFDGTNTWPFDLNGDDQNELAGDLNADGIVDLGGPTNKYYAMGESEGGIMSGVLSAAEPAFTATAPVVGGGGLSDVSMRSREGGIREATLLRAIGILMLGEPNGDGGVDLAVNLPELNNEPIITLASFAENPEPGDMVFVDNLKTGESFSAGVVAEGRFRVSVRADKGDQLVVRVIKPDGAERERIEEFGQSVRFQFSTFTIGQPLIALGDGFGLLRNTPEFRRVINLIQTVLDGADPINYAPHVFLDPLYVQVGGDETKEFGKIYNPGESQFSTTNILWVPTIGDINVPVGTEIAYARAAGLLDFLTPLPQYDTPYFDDDGVPGVTANKVLLKMFTIEGVERFRRLTNTPWNDNRAILADPDAISEGTDCFPEYCIDQSCQGASTPQEVIDICEGDPSTFKRAPRLEDLGLPPLRLTVDHGDGTFSAMRLPYIIPTGFHGVVFSNPSLAFDVNMYMIHFMAQFLASDGRNLTHDPCLETASCSNIAQTTLP